MADATLSISSRNYSSWSLRGWLICKLSGLDFDVEVLSGSHPAARAELLHLSPSFLVPRLIHGEILVWDTLASDIKRHEESHVSIAKAHAREMEQAVLALPRGASCAAVGEKA